MAIKIEDAKDPFSKEELAKTNKRWQKIFAKVFKDWFKETYPKKKNTFK